MTILWTLVTLAALVAGVMGERVLRLRANRQTEKLTALTERLDVYANYGKLAALRRMEAEETLGKLREEVATAEEELKSKQTVVRAAEDPSPTLFHCADRVPRAEGPLWSVAVEAKGDGAPWTGVRHYAVVADSPEEVLSLIHI